MTGVQTCALPISLKAFARELRTDQTDAEAKLWHVLRASRWRGLKFRRQHPIALDDKRFILDFYCHELNLAIELDGGQHVGDASRDELRDAALSMNGIRTIRFWNNEIFNQWDDVLERLWLETEPPSPQPSPPGGGSLQPLFYVAARGHHADIGGITPGSMPPFSKHISEEGVMATC